MKQGSIILLLFSLAPWFLTKAEEAIAYDYDGFPTIIHNETASLQEYRPKFWYLHVDTKDGGFINLDYRLAGDTLIQEKHYVRVVFGYEEKKDLFNNDFLRITAIRPNGDTYADTLYYRQDEDKVYCLQPEDNKEILVLDYGMEVGDEFMDANGEVFVVKEAGRLGHEKTFWGWYFYRPKKLILVSQQTGMEDIWIEGLGSRHWGITPCFLMTQNKVFAQLGTQPLHAQVSIGYGGNILLEPDVNTDNYKAEMIDERYFEEKHDTRSLEYEFLGDTLYVRGTRNSDYLAGYPYAECLIDDGRIDVLIKSFWPADEIGESEYIFWAKIPGFKPGTYQVGLPGREYVTLECKGGGTTGIDEKKLIPVAPRERGTIYDLSGRKVSSQPSHSLPTQEGQGGSLRKGLYIQNGKKVAVK